MIYYVIKPNVINMESSQKYSCIEIERERVFIVSLLNVLLSSVQFCSFFYDLIMMIYYIRLKSF